MSNCVDCGCKVYNGHCVNCHEETYIMEQNNQNNEMISFSDKFLKKVSEQFIEAKEIVKKDKFINREVTNE